jgi:hypothetical protein
MAEGRLDQGGWVFVTLNPETLDAVRENGAVRNCRDWPAQVPAARPLPVEA